MAAASRAIPAPMPTAAPMIAPIPAMPNQLPRPAPAARPKTTLSGIPATPHGGKTLRDISSPKPLWRALALPGAHHRQDFARARETALTVFGEHQLAAERDIEYTA